LALEARRHHNTQPHRSATIPRCCNIGSKVLERWGMACRESEKPCQATG
jgi:hypothetical protein